MRSVLGGGREGGGRGRGRGIASDFCQKLLIGIFQDL